MSWTDTRIETLKKLWADGLSASQVAAELGGVTRSAVIGKVHRLGLARRAPTPRAPIQRRPRVGRRPALKQQVATPAPELVPVIDADIPVEQRRSLLQLDDRTCRWPVGDPQEPTFFFCGARPLTTSCYCAYHDRVSTNRVSEGWRGSWRERACRPRATAAA